MVGAIIMIVLLLVVIPVGFLMSTPLAAALIGHLLKTNSEAEYADSELLDHAD